MPDLKSAFQDCPVCQVANWEIVHRGPVRDGRYGRAVDARIGRCCCCGLERLEESVCLHAADYESENYRAHLGQSHDIAQHYAGHDELALFTQEVIWPRPLRGKTVADVGCGGGSLLDHLAGLPATAIAIDPDVGWSVSLRERGYQWYPSAEAAAAKWANSVDVAFAIQVIEHVEDPVGFLTGIRSLLAPGGVAIISTPNRNDVLMDLLPSDFPPFFYRTQHRWYFTGETLSSCSKAVGLSVEEIRFIHRYGMSNTLLWLRDKRPRGRERLNGIDRPADGLWRAHLEGTGQADNLYMVVVNAQCHD